MENGVLRVKAPLDTSDAYIEKILKDKEAWILNCLEKQQKETVAGSTQKLTNADIKALAEQALKAIPPLVKRYAGILGVTYGRITIRNQKTRWGSCSAKGNLNFDCLLMLMPEEIQELVVVHELCHRIEMNHSKAFWSLVEGVLPDYKARKKWLKENGGSIMRRMS